MAEPTRTCTLIFNRGCEVPCKFLKSVLTLWEENWLLHWGHRSRLSVTTLFSNTGNIHKMILQQFLVAFDIGHKMTPGNAISHYSDITWGRIHLKLPATQIISTACSGIQEKNIKVPHYWFFVRGLCKRQIDFPHNGAIIQKLLYIFVFHPGKLLISFTHIHPGYFTGTG